LLQNMPSKNTPIYTRRPPLRRLAVERFDIPSWVDGAIVFELAPSPLVARIPGPNRSLNSPPGWSFLRHA
jgi:hypothetical protein